MSITRFNVRVYAIIFNDGGEVLLTDEFRAGTKMTKFPGGGLEYGEGTVAALKREAIEELGQEIEVVDHFYTTDFFQPSMFSETDQIISIYYIAALKEEPKFNISNKPFDYGIDFEGAQSFKWKSIEKLSENDLTLPIDKVVVEILREYL